MQADTTTEKPKRYQCRHIFTDGRRCGSASLRNEEFCYFHHGTRTPVSDPSARKARRETFDLPLPEDRSAIQISIGQVLQRIASNDLDPRRASLLLYGLQIASHNLPKEHYVKDQELIPLAHVEEVVLHPELGALAPEAEASPRTRSERERILDWRDRDLTDRELKLRDREVKIRNAEPRPSIPPFVFPAPL